jgi:hypothetical protein
VPKSWKHRHDRWSERAASAFSVGAAMRIPTRQHRAQPPLAKSDYDAGRFPMRSKRADACFGVIHTSELALSGSMVVSVNNDVLTIPSIKERTSAIRKNRERLLCCEHRKPGQLLYQLPLAARCRSRTSLLSASPIFQRSRQRISRSALQARPRRAVEPQRAFIETCSGLLSCQYCCKTHFNRCAQISGPLVRRSNVYAT